MVLGAGCWVLAGLASRAFLSPTLPFSHSPFLPLSHSSFPVFLAAFAFLPLFDHENVKNVAAEAGYWVP
ncbi:MAG TPA: hypothetical protein PK106_06730 [Bacteroidales bacterium]|nr:hypothetical protein [Bacteroidales bacterium]